MQDFWRKRYGEVLLVRLSLLVDDAAPEPLARRRILRWRSVRINGCEGDMESRALCGERCGDARLGRRGLDAHLPFD